MERDNVGGADNETMNHETTAATRTRTENPSTSTAVLNVQEEIGQSSNTRGELFALKDPELLDCPICTEPLRPPVYQCINGHLACESCCIKIEDKCPICTMPILSIRCRAMESVVESIFTSCVYAQYGCNEKISYVKKSEHVATCQYIPIPCVNAKYGCNVLVSYLEKQEHEATCQYIPISCPSFCGYLAAPKSLYNHHAQEHPDDCRTITFGTASEQRFKWHGASILLRESEENILFSLRRRIKPYGCFICVKCVAPPTLLDMKFSYEITVKEEEEYINLKSTMELDPVTTRQVEMETSYFVPHKMYSLIGLSLQLIIRKESMDSTSV